MDTREEPKNGDIYLVIEGEGCCDQCGKEIIGRINHFTESGDWCDLCLAELQRVRGVE